MNGLIASGERNDEAVEMALFGRVTPYSALTHLFQDEIQRTDLDFFWCMKIRSGLFELHHLDALLQRAMRELPSFPEEHEAVLEKAEALLASWEPKGTFEKYCKDAMRGVTETVRAGVLLVKAGRAYALYKEAAEVQFKDKEACASLLEKVRLAFRGAISGVEAFSPIFAEIIAPLGHTKADLDHLEDTKAALSLMEKEIAIAASLAHTVPLPRFDRFIKRGISGCPIIR